MAHGPARTSQRNLRRRRHLLARGRAAGADRGGRDLAAGDRWLLKAGDPGEFHHLEDLAAAPATWDTIYQFVPQGSTTQARQFAAAGRGGNWLGRPKVEWSSMGTGATTGKSSSSAAIRTGYNIVDRSACLPS